MKTTTNQNENNTTERIYNRGTDCEYRVIECKEGDGKATYTAIFPNGKRHVLRSERPNDLIAAIFGNPRPRYRDDF
jgi:hypothetical protein